MARGDPPLRRGPRSVSLPSLSSFHLASFRARTGLTSSGFTRADAFFGNVCELDLVFNFYKVYAILDECFLAGEVEETSKQVILDRLEYLERLE